MSADATRGGAGPGSHAPPLEVRPMKWSEWRIARALARQTFESRHLVLVPNCNWPGNETDLLVVTCDLRIIDVEVKISRADLKADAKKDKWFHSWDYRLDGERRAREWPSRCWKHYYCLPREIWEDALLAALPSPRSGVLLMHEHGGKLAITCRRRATPNRDAKKISAEDAVDIARLASLRMWDAYDSIDRLRGAPA